MKGYRGYDELKIVPRDGVEHKLDEMTADELTELEMLLMDDITGIKDSIDNARTKLVRDGQYADPDWYRRVHTARRIKARQLEMVKRARKAASRKPGRSLAEFFMDAARLVLNEKAFEAVYVEAEAMRNAAGGTVMKEKQENAYP